MGIVRSGTFKEGNYFGLFLLLSSTLAFYLDKKKIGWFFLVSIVTSFSTMAIISAILFLSIYFWNFLVKKKTIKLALIIIPVLILIGLMFSKTQFYVNFVHAKLFTPTNTLTKANLSKVDRYLTSHIAYEMGKDNPIIGVGPFNYGLHYDKYNNILTLVDNHSEWSIEYFKRKYKRAIPNNVYLEIWGEYGIIGFLFFISFLGITLLVTLSQKNRILTGGILALYLSLIAFPSFIMFFIWVYLAIPYGLLYNKYRVTSKSLENVV